MADIQSNIRVNIDTSDALASIKALQSQISAFQKQLKASSSANAVQAENLQRSLISDINATGKFAARLQTIRSTTESFTTALEKNKLSMGEYFKFGASQVRGFRNVFSSEFNTIEKVARERVKTLQTQYISLGRDANGALRSISVRPLALDMDNLATRQAIVAQRQQIFNQLLKQGSTNLLNFGKNTQWAGRQLMVGFTIPLSIFGSQAARTFMEIEEQAIRFRRVYGELFTPAEEADSMLQQLKDLGLEFAKYGVSVRDTLGLAADAAAMGKTGVDLTAQVSEATRLAVLGSVDQQQALETTISLTNAFGTATDELANKINFLNAVENQTVVSIEDLTVAIPKAGPVVKQLGGDVEDLAFFLTAMKEGGINASEGANALKSGLASLINPTEKAAMMLKSYGINIRSIVESNRGDIKGIVVDFATALDQLDPLSRARAIEQLFGKFQFSRLSTLFQNVIAEGTQAARVLELTNATTSELAQLSEKELARVEESTTFKFRAAVEEFQAALAPIGEEFLKLVTPLIEFGTDVLNAFNNMSDGAKQFVTGTIAILGGIAPVAIMTFGLLANGIANMIKGFAFVRSTILGFGRDTTTLGSQIEYMTNEQLQAAAVAASLDQVHSKLIQTFSSEKSAVESLANAYNRAVQAGSRLMVSPIPSDLARRSQGFANGGIIRGAGTGKSDSIIARVSNGEAIIPAASVKANPGVVSSLISGNMPRFAEGGGVGEAEKIIRESRNVADAIDGIGDILTTKLRELGDAISPQKLRAELAKDPVLQLLSSSTRAKGRSTGSSGIVKMHMGGAGISVPDVSALSNILTPNQMRALSDPSVSGAKLMNNLVFGGPAAANRGQLTGTEFGSFVSQNPAQFMGQLAKQGRVDPNNPDFIRFAQNVANQLAQAGSKVIGESDFDEIIQRALAQEIDNIGTATSAQIREVFDEARKVSTVAYSRTNEAGERVTNRMNLPVMARGQSVNIRGSEIGISSQQPYRAVSIPAGANQINDAFTDRVIRERAVASGRAAGVTFANAAGEALEEAAQTQSPSKRTTNASEGMVQGVEKALIDGQDDVAKAAQTLTHSVTTGVGKTSQSRRVTTGVMKFDEKSGKYMDAAKFDQQQRSRQEAQLRLTNMANQSFGSMINKVQGASFALSSLAGIASMFGGSVGDAAGILFQFSSAMFGLITITELLSKTKLASIAITRANNVAEALGAASFTRLFVSGKGIAGLFTNLGKGLMFGLKFLGPVGIGLSLVAAALPFVVNALEEQRKKLEAFGNVINITASQLKYLGDQAGVSVTETSPLESAALPTGADVTQAQVDAVKQSEEFKNQFAQQIEALKVGSAESMQLALQALAFKLLSSGLPEETVKSTIVALMQEAARTDIQFEFNKIGISPENVDSLIADVQSFLDNAFRDKARFSITGNFSLQDSGDLQKDAEAVGQAYGDMVDSVARQFNAAKGEMSLDEFRAQFNAIEQALLSASDNAEIQAIVMKSALNSIKNIDLRNAVSEIKDYGDQLAILEMIASGVVSDKDIAEYINLLKADPVKEGNEVINARRKLEEKMTNALNAGTQAILNNVAAQEKQAEADLLNEEYESALSAIKQQTQDILLQNQAYKLLTESGWLAADALEAVADANFMAAYSNAANDPAKIKEISDAYLELKNATAESVLETGRGGAPEKTPFQQAIEQLQSQRTEIAQSITSFSKLRKAGFGVQEAFAAAEDPIVAAALATTKVGTDKWRQLLQLIKQINAATQNSKLFQLVAERKATIGLTKAFAEITPLLSKLGLTSDEIGEIFNDPDLARAFIDDLKDGEINSQNILNYIKQIPMTKKVDILFNMSTPEGMTSAFDEAFSRQMEAFDIQERQIEAEFRGPLKAAEDAVKAAQEQVDRVQKTIDSIQAKVTEKQKQIELTIDRPIDALNKQLSQIERSIELEYTRPIDALQEESSDLANELTLMDREVDAINKKYDKQEESLAKIAELNANILEQDKERLDVADAIGRGDIAAAARAIRNASQEESRRAKERAAQALQTAREREIAAVRSESGLSREQIENRQFEISQQIFALEEKREARQLEIRDIQDRIYRIEQLRIPALDSIRQLEDQIYTIQIGELATAEAKLTTAQDELTAINNQKQARLDAVEAEKNVWADLKIQVDAARVNADGYLTSLTNVKTMVDNIKAAWAAVGTTSAAAIANINNAGNVLPPVVTTGSGNGGGQRVNPNWTAASARVNNLTTQLKDIEAKLAAFRTERDSINNLPFPARTAAKMQRLAELNKLITSWSTSRAWTGKALTEAQGILAKTSQYLAYGGMVKRFNLGGLARGTDTVPAMLTPGEFVVRRHAVSNFGVDNLKAINSGAYNSDSVYNYSISVNVRSDANPNEIARAVMTQIKQIDAQKIKGNRF